MTQVVGERTRLDPKLDIVFWMLFGAEQNRELLISLLNAVLHPSTPIASVEVLHAQPERHSVDDKAIAAYMSDQKEMQDASRPDDIEVVTCHASPCINSDVFWLYVRRDDPLMRKYRPNHYRAEPAPGGATWASARSDGRGSSG